MKLSYLVLSLFSISLMCGITHAQLFNRPDESEEDKIEDAKDIVVELTMLSHEFKRGTGKNLASLEALTTTKIQPRVVIGANPIGGKPQLYVLLSSKKSLLDPWGKAIQFDAEGRKNDGKYPDIWIGGPKGLVIGNWDKSLFDRTDPQRADLKNDEARIKETKRRLRGVTAALEAFRSDEKNYPASLPDLLLVTANGNGPYFISFSAIADGWGNAISYDPSGPQHAGKRADVYSVDPNRKVIGNWDLAPSD